MTLANYITFSRLFISPIFLLIYLKYEKLGINTYVLPYILIIILTISELSDTVDGYIARKYNQVTDFGKLIDPMADSIVRICIFLTFTQPPVEIPVLLIFVFLYRDSMVSTLRTICALKGSALAARASGKIKAILQGISCFTITFLMIPYSLGHLSQEELNIWSTYIVIGCALYALASGFEYFYTYRKEIKSVLQKKH